jgi:TolB protein
MFADGDNQRCRMAEIEFDDLARVARCAKASTLWVFLLCGCGDLTNPGDETGSEVIAFVSERDGDRAVYVMNADGTGVRRLTSATTYAPELYPASWSPDGSKIVFSGSYGATPGCQDVFLASLDGTEPTQLTDQQGCNNHPIWSPDGSTIAFMSSRNRSWQLFFMNTDGAAQRAASDGTCIDGPRSWSPDGSSLLFDRTCELDVDSDVYVTTVGGSAVSNLTQSDASRDRLPSWSPDGGLIAFSSNRTGDREIFVMSSSGSGLRNVTNSPDTDDDMPRWSPDGRMLVYQCDAEGVQDLCVISADGSGRIKLTDSQGRSRYASWSRDGSRIAFQDSRSGDTEIYLIAPDGSDLRRLTDSPGVDGTPVWRPEA